MTSSRTTAIIAGLIVIAACGGGPPATDTGRLAAVATTTIVGDLVTAIGGDDVDLEVLMGPGVDPHLYKPSAGDVRRMAGAQAIFLNGLHLEGKMGEVLEKMGQRGVRTAAIAECIAESDLIDSSAAGAGLHDPHVWFDVGLWSVAAECARDALVEIDPVNADGYRARGERYLAELRELDAWVRDRIDVVPPEQRVLVTAHDAFSYFGRAYDFEVRGLLGISTAAEAGTADVQRLAEFIAERRVPAIFVESSVPPRYVEALRQAVVARGFEVAIGGSLYSDALGDPGGPAGTYVGTVRSNVDTIVGALLGPEGG
jgi:manganese/zinc/iron transport system substrate-binding protein